MTNVEIQQKALDTLVIINTAIKNLRLYPATSAMIVQTIDKLHEAFLDIFAAEDSLLFAESERTLLIAGEALPQKDQEKLAVVAFLDLMLNFGLRSISFEKGMTKEELATFVDLMSKKPESLRSKGGIQTLAAEAKLEHILLNQKVYIASDHGRQMTAALDIKDDQIIQYLVAAYPDQDIDLDKVRAMAKDANSIKRIFQSGMTQILQHRGTMDDIDLSEHLVRMIGVLDRVAEKVDRDNLSQFIGKSIADLDPDLIGLILVQKIRDIFGGSLYRHIVKEMDDGKYEAVTRQMNLPLETGSSGETAAEAPDEEDTSETEDRPEEDGREAPRPGQAASVPEEQDEQQPLQASVPDTPVQQVVEADEDAVPDHMTAAAFSDTVRQVAASHDPEQTEALIEKVVDGLFGADPEIRARASASLVEIIDGFPVKRQPDLVRSLSQRLVEWVRQEETASLSYKKICRRLKDLVADDIRGERFDDAVPVLDVFSRVFAGVLEKNDTVHALASEIIGDLASGDLLEILFEEFNTDKKNKRLEAGRALVRLGEGPLNRLLDMLREHKDSNERVRILQLLTDAGQMAVPVIRARIKEEEPWYYLRNLAYLLGRVGHEANLDTLKPLLFHHYNKVRQEALNSIYRIGGNERGPLLLSVLARVDASFKISVIKMLGILKFAGAVEPLVQLLMDRPLREPASRTDLEENICTVLGHIGAPEAIPALSKVSRSGSFFSVRPYPERVINAAEKALALIKMKEAEAKR